MNQPRPAQPPSNAAEARALEARTTSAAEAGPSSTATVPDYELLRRIGKGAYGEVWIARSRATGVLRAAKIVWRHTFEDARPFQREFEGLQHFERISREHPSLLALFHIGRNEAEGYFYYVMELADDVQKKRSDGGLEYWSDEETQAGDANAPPLQHCDTPVPQRSKARTLCAPNWNMAGCRPRACWKSASPSPKRSGTSTATGWCTVT